MNQYIIFSVDHFSAFVTIKYHVFQSKISIFITIYMCLIWPTYNFACFYIFYTRTKLSYFFLLLQWYNNVRLMDRLEWHVKISFQFGFLHSTCEKLCNLSFSGEISHIKPGEMVQFSCDSNLDHYKNFRRQKVSCRNSVRNLSVRNLSAR